MCFKSLHRMTARHTGFALSLLLASAFSLPANATEKWNINIAKSHFSAGTNTLVLERNTSSAEAGKVQPGNAANGHFLVIAGDKVYLATDETAFEASGAIKTVDYNRWKQMKMTLIGEKVHSNDFCIFRCMTGHQENRRTVTFTAVGGDPSSQMSGLIALNTE